MKVNDLEIQPAPIGSDEEGSSAAFTPLIDQLHKRIHVHDEKWEELSYWQLIFLQSKVNGCFYNEEELPLTNWHWPKNTWFQERLSQLRRNVNC